MNRVQITKQLTFPLIVNDSNYWIVQSMTDSRIYTEILYSEFDLSQFINGRVDNHFFKDCSKIPVGTKIEKYFSQSNYNCFYQSNGLNTLKYLANHQ